MVQQGFWRKARQTLGRVPFTEEAVAAFHCATDSATPMAIRATLLGALAYFVLPFDAIPDIVPILGFTDDAAMLAAAMKVTLDSIKPEHREAARRKLSE